MRYLSSAKQTLYPATLLPNIMTLLVNGYTSYVCIMELVRCLDGLQLSDKRAERSEKITALCARGDEGMRAEHDKTGRRYAKVDSRIQ